MTFGEKIQILRLKKGISQKQFSKESGIPFYTIVSLEYDRTKIPLITTVIKLAHYFKLSIIEIIEGVDFKK